MILNKNIKNIIIIGIVVLLLSGLLYIILNQKERYFKRIKFDTENTILNATKMKYLDTVVYAGLKSLNIKNSIVSILPIKSNSDAYLGEGIEVKAYIVYDSSNYYIFVNEMNRDEAIKILSHELIHLNQYYTKILSINVTIVEWNKKTYIGNDIPYNDRPWEIDAFKYQDTLRNKINNQLY